MCAEVAVLSNLAQVFGLLDSIKRILSVRRQMTDPGEKQVLKTLTSEYSVLPFIYRNSRSWKPGSRCI